MVRHLGNLPGLGSLGRRGALAALVTAPLAVVASAAGPATASGGGIPRGYADVDPRTARRVPLWHELSPSNPLFPGDPPFTFEIHSTIPADGFLMEHVTSLGTHTGTHISAPAHFIEGGRFLSELDEGFSMMPLAVVDVRSRIAAGGPDFQVSADDLRAFERRHGRIPARGCVLLLTGYSANYVQGPYDEPAPGFSGEATAWLFERRGILAIGSDTYGPDATSDTDFSSTFTALEAGGITVENVGPGLAGMRRFGDWVSINGGRPHFSGFQMGITGFTLPG
jgi:kynurenine formamidase